VDQDYQAELQVWAERDPREYGQPFSVWTCADLARCMTQEGYVQVSAESVRRHLHRLAYRVLRPVLHINSPDPEYGRKVEVLKELEVQARRGEIILLFEDEVDLNLLPGVIGCWTRRGEQRKIPTPGQNQKCYGFGAVHYTSGRLTRHFGEHKDSAGFCALIEQVVQAYCPGEVWQGPRVFLVVDNYIIHRSKQTLALLACYADRLSVMALPTYSPKLNLIELLWKYLRRKVTHNHLFESITQLLEAVETFFRRLDENLAEVLSVIGNPA
jgi:putative transposase